MPSVRAAGRTVHPELTAAVLWALGGPSVPPRVPPGAPPGAVLSPPAAVRLAERCLAEGAPVPEQVHRELLAHLHRLGWPAVRGAADRLFARPRDPLLRTLLAAADLAELVARSRLAEPWLYVGHATRTRLLPGELTVQHLGGLGHRPRPAETLFVCAVHLSAVTRVHGPGPEAVLLTADGRSLPPPALTPDGPPVPLTGWRIRWTGAASAPSSPGQLVLGELRTRIAREPAGPWRLSRAAAELGLPARTLQRTLAASGTSFQAELAAVRLDTAGHLLRRTDLPIAEVAAAAGFTDHPHLTHRFRARHGCTPSEFRRRGETGHSGGPGPEPAPGPTRGPARGPGPGPGPESG
ncbi:helix-turn-helix transcriptional regulator [Kitasatospora phosalacinea]|uniref:helix-turn-helix transcriptional regulator n=1 Tax=Kitasatospora phosalacinea TaxID=2065 RepID=UPI0036558E94